MLNSSHACFIALALAAVGCAPPGNTVATNAAAVSNRKGVDYSFARPSPSGLAGEGYSFVVRYFSTDNSGTHGKILFKAEADALKAAGLDIVSNWEYAADDALNGYNAGVSDAQEADAQATAAGAPAGRPIYFSVDFDATPAQQTAINSYFDGVASVIGHARTGAYGGYYVIQRLFDAGKISYGWQTYAWSGGQWDARAQLRQTQNGITAAGDGSCCDLDEAQADDFGQWGHNADWAAGYVSQSWPLASTAMKMTTGQTVAANIVLKNTGAKTWDSNTKLGTTQPRDRSSPFADKSWLAPNRAAHVTGTVPPGGTFKFAFNFHAPSTPGTYHEYFSLVEESVAWFSDPGQGGPPDNQIEAWIDVAAPAWSAEFVGQSFPLSTDAPLLIGAGQSVDGWIDLKNVGTATWTAGVTKLAPTPRDQPSPLGASNWLSPTRVSTVAADVPPGAVGRFPVTLTGNSVGDVVQTFALVQEGTTWFSDPANGGGPADDFLKVKVSVTSDPQPPPPDGGVGPDLGNGDDGGGGGDDGGGGEGGSGGSAGGTGGNGGVPAGGSGGVHPVAHNGCAMGGDGATTPAWIVLLAFALVIRRTRQAR